MTTPLPGYRGNWTIEFEPATKGVPRAFVRYLRDETVMITIIARPGGSLASGKASDNVLEYDCNEDASLDDGHPYDDAPPWVVRALKEKDPDNPNPGGSAATDWNHAVLEASKRFGWSRQRAGWCLDFLLTQLLRPEHQYNENGVPISLLPVDKWKLWNQKAVDPNVKVNGLHAHNVEHGDWTELSWMGRELDWPLADAVLFERLMRAIRCEAYWRQHPYQWYFGAPRTCAYLIEGCTAGLVRCAELPLIYGPLAKEIATCLSWHLQHIANIWPLLHPNSGGGHQPIKDVVEAAQQTAPDSWAAKGFGMSWQVARLMWAARRCAIAMTRVGRDSMSNLAGLLHGYAKQALDACFRDGVLLDDFVLGDGGAPDFSRSVPYNGHTFGQYSSTQTWILGATCGVPGLENIHQFLRAGVPVDYWNPEHERFVDLVDLLGLVEAEVGP